MFGHGLAAPVDWVVGADGDRLGLVCEIARRGAGRILARGEDFDDDVAVGEHPLQAIVLAADRHCADIELGELRAASATESRSPTHSGPPLITSRAVLAIGISFRGGGVW